MIAIWSNVIVEANNHNQSISSLRPLLAGTQDEH